LSAASSNRGSRLISREADLSLPVTTARADLQSFKDENARLREEVARLDRELARARRCLSASRLGREAQVSGLKSELQAAAFGTSVLCRIAFPADSEKP
jgi:hypothetical protein